MPFRAWKDLCLFHQALCERGIQWRQRKSVVAEHLDQLPTCAEQDHGPKLRVNTAAEDQLVSLQLDHRLDGHALKTRGAGFLANRSFDLPVCGPDGLVIFQVSASRRPHRSYA